MRHQRLLIAASGALLTSTASAMPFMIDWFTINSGGETLTGGALELNATVGQPDADAPLAGGPFQLVGGFWAGVDGSACNPAVLNGDGALTPDDIALFVTNFTDLIFDNADIDGDGDEDPDDIAAFVDAFTSGCS